MESGFIHCTSNRPTVRIPLKVIPNQISVYVCGIADMDNISLCPTEVPFQFVENPDTKESQLEIARIPGQFFWVVLDPSKEDIIQNTAHLPDKYNYIYDTRTGLVHTVTDGPNNPGYWGYNTNVFNCIESEEYKHPILFAIDNGEFAPVGSTMMKTWYRDGDYKRNLGVITSWNTPCGIAEYSRQILEQCEFPYTILAPLANDLIRKDKSNVHRCFQRNDIDGLKKKIEELNIDNLWIHYSYTWFRDDKWEYFLKWCKTNNISYHVFAHSQIRSHHVELVDSYSSGNPRLGNYIPIAPPEFNNTSKVKRNTIGTFGFAHPHKQFETVFNFVKNHKVHYHIWTSVGQGPDAKQDGLAYIDKLHRLTHSLGIVKKVHIHLGFIPEDQLLAELSQCQVLVLPYKDIPTENQSASVAAMRSTGRPIVTTTSPKLKSFSDISRANIYDGLEYAFDHMQELEISAVTKKATYTKHDEAMVHFGCIKPYGNVKTLWRGDLVGVKSFSIVNQKYIKIMQGWGAEVALMPDNNDFKIEDEPEYIREACRHSPREDMISTGLHFPPLLSYCNVPIGAWETSKVPETWLPSVGPQCRKIVVISNFVKEAFINGGFKEDQIVVVPLGVDKYCIDYQKANIYNVSTKGDSCQDRPFTFLSVCWAEPRKGTDVLIDAYTRSFTAKDNVILLIKTSSTNEWLDNIVTRFKEKRPKSAPILIIEGVQDSLEEIYKCADVFVHPLRGEGFGLPVLEAAAYGIPSIVTKWAGPLDFTNNSTSWYIDHRLVAADYQHYVEGAKWAEPNVHHLASLMKRVYNRPDETKQKGLNSFIKSLSFSWENSTHQLIRVFEGL
jgi:glycosyltransferase involved in cell wall biosynthesis